MSKKSLKQKVMYTLGTGALACTFAFTPVATTSVAHANYDTWNEPTDGKWHARTFRDYLNNKCVRFLYYKERNIKEHLNNFKRYKRK